MPIKSLKDRKCLVTGAASGIGRAVALLAGAEGAQLCLTDINAAELERVVEQVRGAGGTVLQAKALDISDYEAVKAFAAEIHGAHGSLDVAMNVAGISIWGTVENLKHEQWRRVIDVDLMGPIHVIECFIPPMIEAKRGGHLVNVSSAAGLFGLPWHAAYSAAKFGLRGISEVLRFDLARHGIGVSLVVPGGVDTGLVNTIQIEGLDMGEVGMARFRDHFRKRAVSPEKAAKAILKGIVKNQYFVYTSNDIRIGHFFQQKFALPYEMVMRGLNDRLDAMARKQKARKQGRA